MASTKEYLNFILEQLSELDEITYKVEAQCYATGFYEREGFVVCSDEFLEDGIPHVQMILNLV